MLVKEKINRNIDSNNKSLLYLNPEKVPPQIDKNRTFRRKISYRNKINENSLNPTSIPPQKPERKPKK